MLGYELIQPVLFPEEPDPQVLEVFSRVEEGQIRMSRHLGSESVIRALQRLLIFLGYSTFSGGSYAVDGDFRRGTNRGVTQFQVDHQLVSASNRKTLCYDCNYQQIFEHYKTAVFKAIDSMTDEKDLKIAPAWILSIIRQETSGVVRPRFEQDHLSKNNRERV